MTVREVMEKYNRMVAFPISAKKIEKAGYNPTDYLISLGEELEKCEDSKTAKRVILAVRELKEAKQSKEPHR